MRSNRHGLAIGAAAIAVALTLAGAAIAATRGHAVARAAHVTVTEREYSIKLSTKSLAAGSVTFTIHNAGHIAHALALSGAGLKTVNVPTIAAGATRSVTVKTKGGTLSLWCPLPGHASLGMKASLKLTGAAASSGDTSTGSNSGAAWG